MTHTETTHINIRVNPDLKRKLAKEAKEKSKAFGVMVTISDIVRSKLEFKPHANG